MNDDDGDDYDDEPALPGMQSRNRVGDPKGAIHTPDLLALALVRHVATRVPLPMAPVPVPLRFLEPEVGGGAMVRAVQRVWPSALVTGIDCNPEAAGFALCDTHHVGDWPAVERTMPALLKWDVSVMNPPFGKAVGMRVTIAHVLAAIRRSTVVTALLPVAYLTGARFDAEVWAPHPPRGIIRITDRPWPKQLREVCAIEWGPGAESEEPWVRTLDWRRD